MKKVRRFTQACTSVPPRTPTLKYHDKDPQMAASKKSQKAAGKAGEKVGRQFIGGLLNIAQERIDNSLDGRIAQSFGDGERVAPKSYDSALEARIARSLEGE